MNDSMFPFRKTARLHDYACYFVDGDTGKKTWMYCESMNAYNPGEKIPAVNGRDYYIIDFEL